VLLSLSSQLAGYKADIDQAVDIGSEDDTGVPRGKELRRLALSLHDRNWSALEEARNELIRAMGAEALVDSVGVVAQFEAVNRVADSTGTKIDDMLGQAMKAGIGPSKLPEPEWY
jgi:hypothetical protein